MPLHGSKGPLDQSSSDPPTVVQFMDKPIEVLVNVARQTHSLECFSRRSLLISVKVVPRTNATSARRTAIYHGRVTAPMTPYTALPARVNTTPYRV